MKLDFDVLEKLLAHLEENTNGYRPVMLSGQAAALGSIDGDTVLYHAKVLHDAGMIDASVSRPLSGPPTYAVLSLTWQGHQLLEGMRNDTLKSKIVGHIKSLGMEGLKQAPALLVGALAREAGI